MNGKLTVPQIAIVLDRIRRGRRKVCLELHYDGSGEDGFVVYITKKRIESESDAV